MLMLFNQAADSGCLHVNVEENWRVNCHKTFDIFSSYITAVINTFKLIKIIVAQWTTIAHLGASIMFGKTIIYDAQ